MSDKYPGGIITKNAITPTPTSAPGIWTLEQQMQAQKAGIWPYGGPFNYIEDVFSTWLYTGNDSTQTITNGIDLSTKGGLVWIKARGLNEGTYPQDHSLIDTVRGPTVALASNLTSGNLSQEYALGTGGTFNSNGFTIASTNPQVNASTVANGYASWTFREQPKFFDVVTWTGTGANRTIAHNLGSVPGCIIVKRTDTTGAWQVYHRSLANTEYLVLNSTAGKATGATRWNSTTATSSVFSLGTDATVNASGGTYVAYIFAHNAGGFGLTGTDNVVTCGTYVGTGSPFTVTLGYEPQWVMIKTTSGSLEGWSMLDNMRGMPITGTTPYLFANSSNEENLTSNYNARSTATGFVVDASTSNEGADYIYVAIRRGPMKVPTSGTSVLGLNARTGTGANETVTGSAGVTDLAIIKNRGSTTNWLWASRLMGPRYVSSNATTAETAAGTAILQANPWDVMDGVNVGTTSNITNASGNTFINYLFERAPSVLDVCCYTGTGSNTTQAHNLGVVPELIIVKRKDSTGAWDSYSSALANTEYIVLNTTAAKATGATRWNSTSPTSSVFSLGTSTTVNANNGTYVAYLFATCAGVSKVGGYTGTGATLQINCGFTGGARFVLIKRTDATANWHVWDTARGMVSGTDLKISPNLTTAESNSDWVFTDTTGFQIVTSDAAVNASGGTYIFLAIA
jgi:hypothetical protein